MLSQICGLSGLFSQSVFSGTGFFSLIIPKQGKTLNQIHSAQDQELARIWNLQGFSQKLRTPLTVHFCTGYPGSAPLAPCYSATTRASSTGPSRSCARIRTWSWTSSPSEWLQGAKGMGWDTKKIIKFGGGGLLNRRDFLRFSFKNCTGWIQRFFKKNGQFGVKIF